jgi:hypothetical protein
MSTLPNGLYVLNSGDSGAINQVTVSGSRRLLLANAVFDIDDAVSVAQSNTAIEGIVTGATELRIAAAHTGDGILFDKVQNGVLQDVSITAVTPRATGNAVHIKGGDPSVELDPLYPLKNSGTRIVNVDMVDQYNGIVISNDSDTNTNWRAFINGGFHRNFTTGGCGIWVNCATVADLFGGSHNITDYWFGQTPTDALAGIRLTGCAGNILTNNNVFGADYALLIDPVEDGFMTSITVIGGFYDRSNLAVLRIAPHDDVAKFGAITFEGVWFAGATAEDVCQIVGTAAKYITFTGCHFYSAETAGKFCARIDGASYVEFIGCTFAGAKGGGLLFTGSAHHFKVQNCMFSTTGIGTGETTLPLGIQIDAGCDHYEITGNDLSDAGIATKITNTPGDSANRRVTTPNVTA